MPTASSVNKAAKLETLRLVNNLRGDVIGIINRRRQRVGDDVLPPYPALVEASRLGYKIMLTAKFSRSDDDLVMDVITMSDADIGPYFGRGTSKNLSVDVSLVRPRRELVGRINRNLQRDNAPLIARDGVPREVQEQVNVQRPYIVPRIPDAVAQRPEFVPRPRRNFLADKPDIDAMYEAMLAEILVARREIVDVINRGRETQLSEDDAERLAEELGYGVRFIATMHDGEIIERMDGLTVTHDDLYNDMFYNKDTVEWEVTTFEPTEGEQAVQNFMDGISNCLMKPIIDMLQEKLDAATTKTAKNRMSSKLDTAKRMQWMYLQDGVPQSHIQRISDELGINIFVDAPFQCEFIKARCKGYCYGTVHVLNTRTNHVDRINEVTTKNTVFVTREELDEKIASLRKFKSYFEYQRHGHVITYVRTLGGTYRVKGHLTDFTNEQERKYGLDNAKLCDVNDAKLSRFIRCGLRFNTHVDVQDTSSYARTIEGTTTDGISDYKKIDMKNAYKNFFRCKQYTGIPTKITDFRPMTSMPADTEGYYLIENVVLSDHIAILDEKLGGVFVSGSVYTRPELQFLTEQNCTYNITFGAVGPSNTEFRFDDPMWDEKDNGVRLYAKWVGKKAAKYSKASHFVSGPQKFLNHVAACVKNHSSGATARIIDETNELYVTYNAERSDHLAHVAGYIAAYTRLQVLEQLLAMDITKILRVASDAVYFIDHEFELCNVFRHESDIMKGNTPGFSYVNVDIFDKRDLPECEARAYNKVEYHEGAGGSGKTHYNIHDKGLQRVIYASPTHKLARSKAQETGIRSIVWARLCSGNPEKWAFIAKFYSVIIVDEISMMPLRTQRLIQERFPNHKIIFCGDLCQLPHYEKDGDGLGFDKTDIARIVHTKNHRIAPGDRLLDILNDMRDNIDVPGYARKIAPLFQRIRLELVFPKYAVEDMILSYSNDRKDFYRDQMKAIGKPDKWMVKDKNAKYCRGDIVIGDKPKVTCELQHAFTVHSVQGETVETTLFIDEETLCDNRLAYTALSRARRYDQIYITR